jgi:hypothetical protein
VSELFDEVDEDVRRDQLKRVWDRYSIYIVAGALLIVAAVGGWRGYQYVEAKKAAEASVAFDKAVELSEANKHAEAEAAFNSLAAIAPSGYRMLARLRAAGEAASHDPKAAWVPWSRNLPRFAALSCSLKHQPIPTCWHASKLRRHRALPFAIPRANCWRCRPGAPTIRRRRENGWI